MREARVPDRSSGKVNQFKLFECFDERESCIADRASLSGQLLKFRQLSQTSEIIIGTAPRSAAHEHGANGTELRPSNRVEQTGFRHYAPAAPSNASDRALPSNEAVKCRFERCCASQHDQAQDG